MGMSGEAMVPANRKIDGNLTEKAMFAVRCSLQRWAG